MGAREMVSVTKQADQPDMEEAQPPAEGATRPTWRVGDVVLTGALMASAAGTLLKSTVAGVSFSSRYMFVGGYQTGEASHLLASVGSTCMLFFIALLAVFLAGVRLSQEGGVAALIGRVGTFATLALSGVAVVVWVVGMAWTLAELPGGRSYYYASLTATRLLGAGEIGAGVMAMLALAVMAVGLLSSWKVRGVASFMHCCALLIFEALSVIGCAAELLYSLPITDYDDKEGLVVEVVGGGIAAAALVMLMGVSVAVQRGAKMCAPQVCLCVLLAIGVIVAEGGRIHQLTQYIGVWSIEGTLVPYIHVINAVGVIVTGLTTCGGTTEITQGEHGEQGVQPPETSDLQRASWRVGDMVLTGALLASAAGILLQSTIGGYLPRRPTSYMMSSVGSSCALFFIALLAVFLAGVRLSQEGGVAALVGRVGTFATLALSGVAVVVWVVGMAWSLADLGRGFGHNTAVRLLGAGEIGAGVMAMLALAVMAAGLLRSWKVRGVASFMHCCALLIFEALSVIGYAAETLDMVNGFSFSRPIDVGLEMQIAGGAIAVAALLMLMVASVAIQCGAKLRIPQVCLCVLLTIGVIVTEGGRIKEPLAVYLAYEHVIVAVAVIVTVLTTCSGPAHQSANVVHQSA